MQQFLGLEELYVAIPGFGGAVCSNSWAWRSCMQQFLGVEELYVAIPRLGGGVYASNHVIWRRP